MTVPWSFFWLALGEDMFRRRGVHEHTDHDNAHVQVRPRWGHIVQDTVLVGPGQPAELGDLSYSIDELTLFVPLYWKLITKRG